MPVFSFRVQLAVVLCACVALTALAFVLISDAVQSAENRLVREATQQVRSALAELTSQYSDQENFRAEDFHTLPPAAAEVSLKGLSLTVLRSYEQVIGGFAAAGALEGASGELTPSERSHLNRLVNDALPTGTIARSIPAGEDVLVIAAQPVDAGQRAAWTMRKLAGVRSPSGQARRFWIAGLVMSALLGTGGIVAIWYVYRSSAIALGDGLKRMEADVNYRMPAIGGDFGHIASAINRMADRRRQLEEGIRRHDRLAALGKVVAGVAHEIRNPLNSAILTLELLDTRVRKGQASEAEVQSAIAEIRRLDEIVTRFLVFGKPSLSERKHQPLAPLASRAIEIVRGQARQKNVEVISHFDESLTAPVDAPQIEQVLVNLLLNAIEACPAGLAVEITLAQMSGAACVHVDDQGQGVSPESAAHIFDAYFTTKSEGSGLGLAVSREIAELHGGSLLFQSRPGRTRFTLTLPSETRA